MQDPAFFDDYHYKYDKSKRLVEQAIYKFNDTFLLNVRKVYTNNVYFGVEFTCFDKLNGLTHRFRCKDRKHPNYSEDVVNNKKMFLSSFKATKESNIHHYYAYTTGLKEVKQDYSVNGYDIYYLYKDDNYHHAHIKCLNTGIVQRGIYKANNDEEFKDRMQTFGYAITTSEPSENDLKHLISQANSTKANYVFTVSTAYSNIIVERDYQYNNTIQSEIKNGSKKKKAKN